MKKLIKILAVSAFMLTIAMSLVGCKANAMKNIYDEDAMVMPILTEKTQVSISGDYELEEYEGNYAVFSKDLEDDQVEYVLFNLDTNSTVVTKTSENGEYDIELTSLNGVPLACVLEGEIAGTDKMQVSIYYGDTYNSYQVSEDEVQENSNLGIVVVGDDVYREKDGAIYVTEHNGIDVIDLNYSIGGYYYDRVNYSGGEYYLAYDENLELTAKIVAPSYAEDDVRYFVLSNGNLIMQYTVMADRYSDDYDFMMPYGEKFNLVTVLYNAKKATQKEIKFNYVIEDVYSSEYFSKRVDNIAELYEIKDKKIDMSENGLLIANLSDNGKVKIYDKAHELLESASLEQIENGYLGYDYAGKTVLLDKKLNIVGRYDDFSWSNENAFLADDKIYDYEGVVLIDLEEQGYSLNPTTLIGSLILSKTTDLGTYEMTEKYLYTGGTNVVHIATSYTDPAVKVESSVSELDYFGLTYYVTSYSENSVKYTVYNARGEVLLEKSFSNEGEHPDYYNGIGFEISDSFYSNLEFEGLLTFSYRTYNATTSLYETVNEFYVVK